MVLFESISDPAVVAWPSHSSKAEGRNMAWTARRAGLVERRKLEDGSGADVARVKLCSTATCPTAYDYGVLIDSRSIGGKVKMTGSNAQGNRRL
jgi:hypothetical protein